MKKLLIALVVIANLGLAGVTGYLTYKDDVRQCMLPPRPKVGGWSQEIGIPLQAWSEVLPKDKYIMGRCMASEDFEQYMQYLKEASGCGN